MKNNIYFPFFLLFSIFISCNKNPIEGITGNSESDCWSPPATLPENDGVVYNLAFMKNDTAWVAAESTDGVVDLVLSGVPINIEHYVYTDVNFLVVRGDLNIRDECKEIFSRIYFYVVNPVEGINDSLGVSTGFSDFTNNKGFDIDFLSPREVFISKLDLENGRAEGTFEFNLIDENTQDTLHIRDGRFEGDF